MALRLPNGMIVFIGNQTLPGPKLLDIEITNTFPLIKLEKIASVFHSNQQIQENISGYNHVSLPPDLRLHISGPNDHIFFDVSPVWNMVDNNSSKPLHYFSFIGLPYHRVPPLVEFEKTKKWHEAAIIFPFQDKDFNSATRLFVDFFIHHNPVNLYNIIQAPLCYPTMRLAHDQSGSLLGPFSFASIQRRKKPIKNIALTIRFGYVNIKDSEEVFIYTPLKIFQKRPKL